MKIESRIGKSTSSDREIYDFITDFNNFRELLPEDRVSDWEASRDRCSFRVDPVGKTGLEIVEKVPHSLVKMASVPEFSKYNFTIWIQLKRMADDDTRIRITIEPRVSIMLLPVIKGPLRQFVDTLMDRVETF
ncbi:MAG: hypothetical protein EHM46_06730, partial [Bacteroidetes bacterium]